jgi:hypothetical protein
MQCVCACVWRERGGVLDRDVRSGFNGSAATELAGGSSFEAGWCCAVCRREGWHRGVWSDTG